MVITCKVLQLAYLTFVRLNIFIVSNLRNIFPVKMASNINIELTSVVLTS